MFGGGSGRIVGDHAGGAPVSGEHHICGGCASAGEFGGQADAAGVGGDAAVDTCGLGGGGKAPGDSAGGERHHAIARLGLRLGPERAEGRCYTVLDVPEVGRLTGRVRFRGSDADKDAGGRGVGVGDVGPAKGGDFGSAQPGHEKQPGDHGVQSAAPDGGGLGLNATPGFSRPVARGKDGRKVVGGKGVGPASAAIGGGAPETCEDAAGRFSGRVRVVGQAGAKPGGGDGEGGDARAPAGVVEDGQIGGEGRVVQGTTAAPGVELAEGAAVALAGVRTEGGGDKAAGGRAWRGRRRAGDRARIEARCGQRITIHKGNYGS